MVEEGKMKAIMYIETSPKMVDFFVHQVTKIFFFFYGMSKEFRRQFKRNISPLDSEVDFWRENSIDSYF